MATLKTDTGKVIAIYNDQGVDAAFHDASRVLTAAFYEQQKLERKLDRVQYNWERAEIEAKIADLPSRATLYDAHNRAIVSYWCGDDGGQPRIFKSAE